MSNSLSLYMSASCTLISSKLQKVETFCFVVGTSSDSCDGISASLQDDRNTKRPQIESDTIQLLEQERVSADVNGTSSELTCIFLRVDKLFSWLNE